MFASVRSTTLLGVVGRAVDVEVRDQTLRRLPSPQRFLAGTDQQRAAALMEALCEPEVDAVLCARGGAGTGRLLEAATNDIPTGLRLPP